MLKKNLKKWKEVKMTTDAFVKKANEIIALTFGLAKWINI